MSTPKLQTEVELAAGVSAWLRGDGWTCYHEVPAGSGRIDILAVRAGLVWAIETKLRASLEVVEQALDRARRAAVHGALVAVPGRSNGTALAEICRRLGLGVICAREDHDGRGNLVIDPCIRVWPEFRRQANVRDLLAQLAPEQQAQAAGKNRGTYWTPFKEVVRDLVNKVAAAGRLSLSDASDTSPLRLYKPHHDAAARRRYVSSRQVRSRGRSPGGEHRRPRAVALACSNQPQPTPPPSGGAPGKTSPAPTTPPRSPPSAHTAGSNSPSSRE